MKYMVLMILLSTLLFSYEKYIIVGSYKKSVNAVDALKKLKELSVSDTELKDLIEKNSLKIVSKKIREYEVVTLQALNNDVKLQETLKVLKKYYDGAYVIYYKQKKEKAVKKKIETKPVIVDYNLNKTALNNKTEATPAIVDYTWDETTKSWVELVPKKKK
jgi:hypothetical protein